MSELSDRINNFIAKQIKVGSRAEAEAYGIKLPPEEEGTKWQGDTTQAQPHAQATGEKVDIGYRPTKTPKVPKVPKAKTPKATPSHKVPKNPFRTSHYQVVPNGPLAEVAHQLTPKGPGYHSPEDIADDYTEAKRLAGRVKNIGKPKPIVPEGDKE